MKLGLVALVLLIGLASCSGRNPDRTIQLCLESEQGNNAFRNILIALAAQNDLEFFDESKRVERELKILDADRGLFPLRHYHLHDKWAGVEITATNLGLGPYEAMLSYDLHSARQRAVAEDLITNLEREFEIIATDNRGANPLSNCPSGRAMRPPSVAA